MRTAGLGWLWPMLRPQRARIALGSAAAAVQTAISLTAPYLFKIAIDRGIEPGRLAVLNALAVGYLALAWFSLLAARIEVRTTGLVGQHTLHAVRCRLFAHLQRLPLAFYQREQSGGVVARMTGDVEAMAGLVSGGLMQLASNVATLTGIAAILAVLDWRLALETLTVAPVLAIATIWFQKGSAAAWRRVREASSQTTVALHETIYGAREIQRYGAEEAALRAVATATRRAARSSLRAVVLGALFFPGVDLASGFAYVVVLGFGGPRVLSGQLGIGTLTAFLLYLGLIFGPVFGLSELYDTVQAAIAGGTRIGAVLAIEPSLAEPEQPAELGAPRGDLRLSGVRFAYPAPDGTPGPEVLHGIDLAIPAGQTLALAGTTGAGKSTIAGLLLRFHDPSAGQVTLDGIDLRRLRLADLRQAIAFVPQEGFLFAGTVEDNIRLGCPRASRSQIDAAVTTLGAWPMLAQLPHGLGTDVGERGKRLASGERQVIALARAWIADPAVLVLDEATSHLGTEAEAQVTDALRLLRAGRTTVLIAHRLSSVLDADIVALIDDGEVTETGSPTELIAARGGFAALHDRWSSVTGHRPGVSLITSKRRQT
jgi:ABC-type multidrug transport system fused ATPase/permease subunit